MQVVPRHQAASDGTRRLIVGACGGASIFKLPPLLRAAPENLEVR
jgi:hypothetical protein